MVVVKVVADITTEIWPVSSRQIAEKITHQIGVKDVVPSSSEGQMMIGGGMVAGRVWRIALCKQGLDEGPVLAKKRYMVVGA